MSNDSLSHKSKDLLVPSASDHPVTSAGLSSSSNLSRHVFSNPKEFLTTIQTNFNEFSQGHDSISLPQLKLQETHGSTPEVRAAATIAANHFGNLANIEKEEPGYLTSGFGRERVIKNDDLNFALDMVDGKILGRTLSDVVGVIALGAMGAGESAIATTMISEGGLLAATGVGGVVVGLGIGGYYMYKGATSYSSWSRTSKDDQQMFKSWL